MLQARKKDIKSGKTPKPMSTWKYGDPANEKPEFADAYLQGVDPMKSLIDHESMHHVSQYWGVNESNSRDRFTPIQQKVIDTIVEETGSIKRVKEFLVENSLSTYGETNTEEFTAESYVCWKNGRQDMVHPKIRKVFEEVGL